MSVFLLVMFLLSSCDDFPVLNLVAVTKKAGELVIVTHLCVDDPVHALEFATGRGEGVIYTDEILWRAEAQGKPAPPLGEYVVGRTPPEFREVVPFAGVVPEGLLLVEVQWDADPDASAHVIFRASNVPEGRVLTGHNDVMPPREFHAQAEEMCRN